MPKYRVSFSVWRMGTQSMFSYLETDKNHETLYAMTYPITPLEADALSSWGTNRARHHNAEPLFDPFGWSVYIDSLDVVNPYAFYHCPSLLNRTDPERINEYRDLIKECHRMVNHCDQ